MADQLILASGSPRRRELLESIGVQVKVVVPNVEELQQDGEEADAYARRTARDKVLAVVQRVRATQGAEMPPGGGSAPRRLGPAPEEPRWVLGADTVVVLDGEIFEKPRDPHHAYEMLSGLGGRVHEVITGFCLFDMRKSKEGIQAVRTQVRFKALTRPEIDKYIGLGEGADKAGGYAIQGVGAYFVEAISGSYTNVVGLPLCQVVEMLEEMGGASVLPY